MACDTTTLLTEAAGFQCLGATVAETLNLAFLQRILLAADPAADTTAAALLEVGAQYQCIGLTSIQAIELGLLQDISVASGGSSSATLAELLDEAQVYSCLGGSVFQWLKLALLARILLALDPAADVTQSGLLTYGDCYWLYTSNPLTVIALALADQVAQASATPVVAPDAPVPAFPEFASPGNYTLLWAAVANATSYGVDVASDAAFTAFIVNNVSAPTNSHAVVGDAASGARWFRVRAVNSAGTSANSNVVQFDANGAVYTVDDFESYTVDDDLGGLNGGTGWDSAYVSRSPLYAVKDDFESYTAGADLGGLNGGTNWDSAYVSRSALYIVSDDFESYTASADLDGLNGGTNWDAAYASR